MEVTDFLIVDPDPSPTGNLFRKSVVNPLDKTNFVGNIKSVRNTAEGIGKHLTLSEARWAVGNWEVWIRFVDEYNRLPISGYGSGEDRDKLI